MNEDDYLLIFQLMPIRVLLFAQLNVELKMGTDTRQSWKLLHHMNRHHHIMTVLREKTLQAELRSCDTLKGLGNPTRFIQNLHASDMVSTHFATAKPGTAEREYICSTIELC